MTQLTSTVLATANSVITVKTQGVMAGAARAITSVNGPGAFDNSRQGTTETAETATATYICAPMTIAGQPVDVQAKHAPESIQRQLEWPD